MSSSPNANSKRKIPISDALDYRRSRRQPRPPVPFLQEHIVNNRNGTLDQIVNNDACGLHQPNPGNFKTDPLEKLGDECWADCLKPNGWKYSFRDEIFYATKSLRDAVEGITKFTGYAALGKQYEEDGRDERKILKRARRALARLSNKANTRNSNRVARARVARVAPRSISQEIDFESDVTDEEADEEKNGSMPSTEDPSRANGQDLTLDIQAETGAVAIKQETGVEEAGAAAASATLKDQKSTSNAFAGQTSQSNDSTNHEPTAPTVTSTTAAAGVVPANVPAVNNRSSNNHLNRLKARVDDLESNVVGSVSEGVSIKQRIAVLEKELFGEVSQGGLLKRLERLEKLGYE